MEVKRSKVKRKYVGIIFKPNKKSLSMKAEALPILKEIRYLFDVETIAFMSFFRCFTN